MPAKRVPDGSWKWAPPGLRASLEAAEFRATISESRVKELTESCEVAKARAEAAEARAAAAEAEPRTLGSLDKVRLRALERQLRAACEAFARRERRYGGR